MNRTDGLTQNQQAFLKVKVRGELMEPKLSMWEAEDLVQRGLVDMLMLGGIVLTAEGKVYASTL